MSNITQQEIATSDTNNNNSKVRSQRIKIGTTKWLTHAAMFSALAIILKFISQYMEIGGIKITVIYVPWLISSAVLGIIGGGTVCFVSDLLISLVFPTGPINPLTILSNTLYGVLGGAVFKFFPSKHYAVKFIAAGATCILVCTCILGSLALYYGYYYYEYLTFWQYFIGFRAWQPLIASISVGITVAMIPLLTRTKLLPQIPTKQVENSNKENQNA